MVERPIIVTLQFDAETDAFFQAERARRFPPALNKTPAHLTLFHQLPGLQERAIVKELARVAARPPFKVMVAGPMALGRGVAYRIEAPALGALRAELASAFAPWLAAQDRGRFRPHVTIQNKVPAPEAHGLFEHLQRTFVPFEATAEGFQVWRYLGGPWRPAGAIAFRSDRLA